MANYGSNTQTTTETAPLMQAGQTQSGIRDAYQNRDGDASQALHDKQTKDAMITMLEGEETHKDYGDYIKSMVYGGLDGIITTFAVVSGVTGANLGLPVIFVMGFANLVANGISMGIGDYLSEHAELDFARAEREREVWEFENFPQGEIAEMVDIYMQKGMSRQDAEYIITKMSKYRDFFVDHMLVQELELQPVSGDEEPFKAGLVTMISFMIFGCVPLLSFLLFVNVSWGGWNPQFFMSFLLTLFTLAFLGGVMGKMTDTSVWKSAAFVAVNGSLAAAAAFAVGAGLSDMAGVGGSGGR